jgi:hypothetical protein
VLRALSNVDPLNLIPNGMFPNHNGVLPTGWTKSGTGAAISTVSVVSGFRGNAMAVTGALPSAESLFGPANITTGFSVGDVIAYSYKYASTGLEDAGRYYAIGIRQVPSCDWHGRPPSRVTPSRASLL